MQLTFRGFSPIVTNLVSEHKVLGNSFGSKVSQHRSSRVLFIIVIHDTSMSERL